VNLRSSASLRMPDISFPNVPETSRLTGQNFNACLDFIRTAEGGYSNDPKDSGNWLTIANRKQRVLIGSHYGVSATLLAAWCAPKQITSDDMKNLSLETFTAIAQSQFWNPLSASALPSGIDLMVFDFGWNAGLQGSAVLLQRMINAFPDGIIGRRTIAALENTSLTELLAHADASALTMLYNRIGHPSSDHRDTIRAHILSQPGGVTSLQVIMLGQMQEQTYREMRGFRRYGRGWLARTQRRMETSLAMVAAAADRKFPPGEHIIT
jgi:lysozyme family protein